MQVITVNISTTYLEAVDNLVARGVYPSRSEAIRVALRDFLQTELEIVEFLLFGPPPEPTFDPGPPPSDLRRGIDDSKLDRAKQHIEAMWAAEVGE